MSLESFISEWFEPVAVEDDLPEAAMAPETSRTMQLTPLRAPAVDCDIPLVRVTPSSGIPRGFYRLGDFPKSQIRDIVKYPLLLEALRLMDKDGDPMTHTVLVWRGFVYSQSEKRYNERGRPVFEEVSHFVEDDVAVLLRRVFRLLCPAEPDTVRHSSFPPGAQEGESPIHVRV